MGLVRMGPPTDLILCLKERYGLDTFVETGTFHGGTAVWASSHFSQVFTVEYSSSIYADTKARYGNIGNIDFILGDSRTVLKTLVPELKTPGVFWLDSHWCGQESYGETDQCPLIQELHEILQSPLPHFLFIDDARLFLLPPPLPNRIEYWPPIDVVMQTLLASGKHYYIVVCEDVIIAVPPQAKEFVADHCQQISTAAWRQYGEQLKQAQQPHVRLGMRQAVGGMRLMLYRVRQQLRRIISRDRTA